QPELASDLGDDVGVGDVLKGAYEAAAREAVQPIERTQHEALRAGMEVRLHLHDLTVEQWRFVTLGLGADRERLPRLDFRLVEPFELRVVRDERRDVRQMQAALHGDLE